MRSWLRLFGFLALLLALTPVAYASGDEEAAKSEETETQPKNEDGVTSFLAPGRVYVNIGPIILPVVTETGPQQIITMLISLQVKDLGTSDKVREQLPRVVDSIMRSLYGKIDERHMKNGIIVNMDYVKGRIVKAVTEIMGDGVVDDVLIQAVAQRQV